MARPLTITSNGVTVSTTEYKSGTGSAYYDTDGDYLRVNQSDGELNVSGAWTIEAWVWITNAANEDYTIFSTRIGPGAISNESGWDLILGFEAGTGPGNEEVIRFTTFDYINGTQSTTVENLNLTLNPSQWYHVAVTSNGTNTLKIWLDGSQIASNTSATYVDLDARRISASIGDAQNNDINIGFSSDTNQSWGGYLDEIRISNTERYTTSFTPSSRFQPDDNTLLLVHADGTNGSTTFTDDVGVQGEAVLSSSFDTLATGRDAPFIQLGEQYVYDWDETVNWDKILFGDIWEQGLLFESSASTTATGTYAIFAEAQLDSQFDISTDASNLNIASAELATEFGVAVEALNLDLAEAQLDSQFSVSTDADNFNIASADLATAFDISTTAQNFCFASAELATAFGVSTDADNFNIASASLESQFSVSTDADNLSIASADLATEFTQIVDGIVSVTGEASFDAAFDISASSKILKLANIALFESVALTSDSSVTHTGSAEIATEFAQVASGGRIVGPTEVYDYTWDDVDTWNDFVLDQWGPTGQFNFSFGTLTVNGGLVKDGAATLDSQFDTSAVPEKILNGETSLDEAFDISAVPTLIPNVLPFELASQFGIDADGDVTLGGVASLDTEFAQAVDANIIRTSGAELLSEFTPVIDGDVIYTGAATLNTLFDAIIQGRLSDVRGTASLDTEFEFVSEGDLKLLESNQIYKILADSRQYSVPQETRAQKVLSENREIIVLEETRKQKILPESRSLNVKDFELA